MALATHRFVDRAIRDAQVLKHPRRLGISGELFPWDKISFGYKINPDGDNPAEIRIYTGNVRKTTYYNYPVGFTSSIAIPTTDFILTLPTTYVYVLATNGETLSDGFSATLCADAEVFSVNQYLLYAFYFFSDIASLWRIIYVGDIHLTYTPPLETIRADLGL